jgi:hypothetical protein
VDRRAVPVNTPVNPRQERSVHVVKPVEKPGEARGRAGEVPNLSFDTYSDKYFSPIQMLSLPPEIKKA